MDRNEAPAVPESVRQLARKYGLSIDRAGNLNTKPKYVLVNLPIYLGANPVQTLPVVYYRDSIHYLVPANVDLPEHLERLSSFQLLAPIKGEGFIPDDGNDWIADGKAGDEISAALREYHSAVQSDLDDAQDFLKRERSWSAHLYASGSEVDEEKPLLVDGMMLETGVSVFYGDFDEFKTTVIVDLVGHLAYGADWQGRRVRPRPVIWYALEGADEIPIRLKALEAKLRAMSTPWGDDRAPVTLRDRIPDDRDAWRKEIFEIGERWVDVCSNRGRVGEIDEADFSNTPLIVIDTLSLALGGDDEKGSKAAGFIHTCLDLLKKRPDLDDDDPLLWPVASHVIIIHHQTKNGTDFAGHRAIASNTHGLYRIHRFGKITDASRPFAGQLTPIRVKGIPRPAPIRFEVEIVPIEGTKQTAAILKDKPPELPKDLAPVIEALRHCEDETEIPPKALNACLDLVAASGEKDGAAKRKARQRYRERLEAAGIIEPVLAEGGNVDFYRFHDCGVSL